jgi:hypothetical protein
MELRDKTGWHWLYKPGVKPFALKWQPERAGQDSEWGMGYFSPFAAWRDGYRYLEPVLTIEEAAELRKELDGLKRLIDNPKEAQMKAVDEAFLNARDQNGTQSSALKALGSPEQEQVVDLRVVGLMSDYAAKAGFTMGLLNILLMYIKSLTSVPSYEEVKELKLLGERIDTELKKV